MPTNPPLIHWFFEFILWCRPLLVLGSHGNSLLWNWCHRHDLWFSGKNEYDEIYYCPLDFSCVSFSGAQENDSNLNAEIWLDDWCTCARLAHAAASHVADTERSYDLANRGPGCRETAMECNSMNASSWKHLIEFKPLTPHPPISWNGELSLSSKKGASSPSY